MMNISIIRPLARALPAFLASALIAAQPGTVLAQAGVQTVRVEPQTLGVTIIVEASIEALRQSTLAAQMPGRIVDLSVDAGDRVQQGQTLVRIDPAEAAAALAAADAGIAQAEAARVTALADYERARSLMAREFISQSALDAARTRFQAADAQLLAARAQRTQAATVQGYATVASPLNGLVAERFIEAGEMAQPGRKLLTVYDPKHMRVVADLAPQRLAELGDALHARVELNDSGRLIDALTVTVLPAADARTHTVRVRVDLPSDIPGLLPGSFARIHFDAAPPSADAARPVVIPAGTVLRRGELTAVYVIDAQGGFALRQVRLGRVERGGEAVEVLSGLKGGETLALDPVQAGIQARSAPAVAR